MEAVRVDQGLSRPAPLRVGAVPAREGASLPGIEPLQFPSPSAIGAHRRRWGSPRRLGFSSRPGGVRTAWFNDWAIGRTAGHDEVRTCLPRAEHLAMSGRGDAQASPSPSPTATAASRELNIRAALHRLPDHQNRKAHRHVQYLTPPPPRSPSPQSQRLGVGEQYTRFFTGLGPTTKDSGLAGPGRVWHPRAARRATSGAHATAGGGHTARLCDGRLSGGFGQCSGGAGASRRDRGGRRVVVNLVGLSKDEHVVSSSSCSGGRVPFARPRHQQEGCS